jgi:hypothetical protein
MKKLLFIALLLVSSVSFADAGFFVDGTKKYARSGEIYARFDWADFYTCPKYESCEAISAYHKYIGVVYSDTKKLKAYLKKISQSIESLQTLYKVNGKGFTVVVTDLTATDGTAVVFLGVMENKKVKYPSKTADIEHILANELEMAYNRAGFEIASQ